MQLIAELKRRNVFRVALLYVVATWLILQVTDVLFEQLGLPGWTFRFVFGLLVICFPLVLLFSWIFELTPEGIKREREIAQEESITRHTGQRINRAITTLLVLAILTVLADRLIPERTAATPQRTEVATEPAPPPESEPSPQVVSDKSIAVLPFVNMSGDDENEYFSDGLTEELLNSLARIGELKVAGRTSSFAFKDKSQDLREIARQLNVAHLLEGSVRKAGNRVRVTAQLVKASDGYHLWSDTFDRELDDIFKIQEEIAERVAAALQATLLGDDKGVLVAEYTDHPEAWESYLRGNYLFQRAPDDEDNRRRAEAEFLHALNLDPAFTLARWGLFRVVDFRRRNAVVAYDEGKRKMERMAQLMLKEAPDLAETHLALGQTAVNDIRVADARKAYRRALELSPGSVEVIQALGGIESVLGNSGQARAFLSRAAELDPLSSRVLLAVAFQFLIDGECEEVERVRDRLLTVEPNAGRINALLGMCLLAEGTDPQRAIELADAEPVGHQRHTVLAIAWQASGKPERARAAVEQMQELYGDTAAYQYAQVHALWGDHEEAFKWLNLAWETGDPGIINLLRDPLLDPLRDDPVFLTLQRKWTRQAGL